MAEVKSREVSKETKPPEQPEMMKLMPKCKEDAVKCPKATYEVMDLLGTGAFGAVFRVRRVSDEKEMAMKCESSGVKKEVLRYEAEVLATAMKINSPHIVQLEGRGAIRGRFVFIVMRLVGRNLWDLRLQQPDKKFSLNTALKVAEQTLAGVRDLHRAGFLHRDIKPPNFAIGREEDGNLHTVYILDFGLSRKFRTTGKDLRMPRSKVAFRGTTRYASLATLDAKEQSRKDDVESWWYMTVEFMLGSLPWKHCKVCFIVRPKMTSIQGKEREEVKRRKQELRKGQNLDHLLATAPMPYIRDILLYCDTLHYESIPDYDYVYRLIAAACQASAISPTEAPDWDPVTPYKGPKYECGLDFTPKIVDDPQL